MKISLQTANSEVQLAPAQATLSRARSTAPLLIAGAVLVLGLALLHLSAGTAGDSLALRCDASALAAVGPSPSDADPLQARQWRQNRKLAFESCVDASFLPQQPATP